MQGRSHWSGWSGFNLTTFVTTRQVRQVNQTTWSCWYCIQPGLTGPLLIGGYGPGVLMKFGLTYISAKRHLFSIKPGFTLRLTNA